MSTPSRLPSAAAVATHCFDKYQAMKPDLPIALRGNLEQLADYCFEGGNLQTLFIRELVPWDQFISETNAGHEAIADFLLAGVIDHAITTNVDWLIERAAWDRLGGDLLAALTSGDAVLREAHHRALLKPHGCGQLDRDNTVWSRHQLTVAPINERVTSLRTWLEVRLQHKDLVVVGFWSDWGYLNEALITSIGAGVPARVIVVDPAETEALAHKAPDLWATLTRPGVEFHHTRMTGEEFLDALRGTFSRWYLRQILHGARATYEATFGTPCPGDWLESADVAHPDLYLARRDSEGVRIGRPARLRVPGVDAEAFGMFLLALRRIGAQREGVLYRLPDDRLVRVLNGRGRTLSAMQLDYRREPPLEPTPDVVACVGATDYGVPGDIVRGAGAHSTVVRPGQRGAWLDGAAARELIGF